MPHGSTGQPAATLGRAARHYRLVKDERERLPRSMSGGDLGF
jgi:hypothetical protein